MRVLPDAKTLRAQAESVAEARIESSLSTVLLALNEAMLHGFTEAKVSEWVSPELHAQLQQKGYTVTHQYHSQGDKQYKMTLIQF